MIEYLTKQDIILINLKTIKRHGGNFVPPFNFLNENSLDYLVEAVQAEMFGEPLYPKLGDKAGLYFYNIICNHIFQDGNKRTGLEAALLFLGLNGRKLKKNLLPVETPGNPPLEVFSDSKTSNDILYNFVINTASGYFELQYCQGWFEEYMD